MNYSLNTSNPPWSFTLYHKVNMKIIRAVHLGMCFGVKDAIALALETAKQEPLTILGDLVHNETVLTELRAQGIRIEQQPAEANTRTVMITAHGASERKLRETRGRGLNVLEATCPLVQVAHRSLAKLVREGFHPVIVGQRGHVEVRGMTEDLDRIRRGAYGRGSRRSQRTSALRGHGTNHPAD